MCIDRVVILDSCVEVVIMFGKSKHRCGVWHSCSKMLRHRVVLSIAVSWRCPCVGLPGSTGLGRWRPTLGDVGYISVSPESADVAHHRSIGPVLTKSRSLHINFGQLWPTSDQAQPGQSRDMFAELDPEMAKHGQTGPGGYQRSPDEGSPVLRDARGSRVCSHAFVDRASPSACRASPSCVAIGLVAKSEGSGCA